MENKGIIIVDIDGTLAHMVAREWNEFDKVENDSLDIKVHEICFLLYNAGYSVVIVSGRGEECYTETLAWLKSNLAFPFKLYMRKKDDRRPDNIVKEEIYNQYLKDQDIFCVFDDRNSVVKMWRELGLKCLQVEEGDF